MRARKRIVVSKTDARGVWRGILAVHAVRIARVVAGMGAESRKRSSSEEPVWMGRGNVGATFA